MRRVFSVTKKEEFDSIFKRGRFIKGSFISFKVKKTNLGHIRIGIIVGQKISKKAVIRNKIKRRIREGVKEFIDEDKSIDIVALPTAEIISKSFKEIKKEIEGLFRKI